MKVVQTFLVYGYKQPLFFRTLNTSSLTVWLTNSNLGKCFGKVVSVFQELYSWDVSGSGVCPISITMSITNSHSSNFTDLAIYNTIAERESY